MSKNTDTFDKICGNCAGLNVQNISAEDVIAQAAIYEASRDEMQAAVFGLIEYQGVTKTATCDECGLVFPADDQFADVFGPSEIKCPLCHPHLPPGAAGIVKKIEPLMLMNPATGTVQSEADWTEDYLSTPAELWGGAEFEDAHLVEVRKTENGEWEEV